MSVLDRLKNKGTNSGWLGETLERARQQREAEEEQKKQNRAKQATNKDFIGPSQEVYTQPQTVPNLLAMTKEQREASAQQGISDVVQSLNRPRKTPLDELREDGSVMTKPGMYTLSKAMQGVGNSVAGMIGAAEGVKDYAQYVLNGRKTPEPLPQLGTRPDPMEAYRDWTEFNTILSNAEQQYVSPARQLYGNVVQGVSGMIFPMATASVTGGMGLVTGISAGGNAAMDAKLQGYNPVESLARGLLTGAVQGAATSALTDKTLGRVLKPTAGNGMKRFLANQGKMMLSEGIEEAIEEPAQLGIDALTLGKMPTAEDWQALPRQMLQSGITGALVGGAMGLPANMIGATAPRNSDTQTDSWTERYRDTQLQQPQNRGTINQTEVALDGQRAKETMGRYVDQTAGRGNVGRNDARGTGSYGTASQAGSAASGEYDTRGTGRILEGTRGEEVSGTPETVVGKDTWTTKTGKQLTYQPVQENQLGQMQHEARSRANDRGFYTVYFDGELDAYNADGTLFRKIDDGTVDGNAIFVRRDSGYPAANIVDHESVHGIKRLQPEAYETLDDMVQQAIYPVEFDAEIKSMAKVVAEAYGENIDEARAYDLALEETLANLSYQINEDTPPSYVADVDAVKQAYDVFFSALGTKVSQQGNTQQEAGMDVHTPEMQRVMQEYEKAVDADLAEFAQYAVSHPNDNKTAFQLEDVSPRAAEDIQRLTGIDVEGFGTEAKANTFRHIEQRHGQNGKADQSMADVNDVARMQYVIDNYDEMELLDATSKEFLSREKHQAPQIMLSKRVDGTYYVVEAVPDTNKRKLEIVSAYKKAAQPMPDDVNAHTPEANVQNDYSATANAANQTADVQAPAPNVRNDSDMAASDYYIPQSEENVKENTDVQQDKWGSDPDRWTAERMEGTSGEGVQSLGEITQFVEQAFGIPVSTGNIAQHGARGIFKTKAETVRTRVANALPTISHELGHYLDKQFELSKLPGIDEAMRGMDNQFAAQYSDAEIPGEAVAEFVLEYLSNRTAAAEKYPTFYQEFLSKLDEQTASKLETMSNMVNRYLSSTAVSRAQSAIKTGKEARNAEKPDALRDFLSSAYQKMVDGNHAIERMTKEVEGTTGKKLRGKNNPYQLATNAANAEARAAYIINTAMTDADGNIISDKSMLKALEPITKENQKDFSTYLVARHAPEWLRPDADGKTKRVFADDTINTPEAATQIAAELEKAHPEFKQAAEDLYEYQKAVMQYWLVDTGMMSKETFDALQEKYPNYVPFYRVTKEPGRLGRAKSGFANQNTPIKRAKGSGLEIQDPIESIVYNTVRFVKAATRNQVMQVLSDYANSVDGLGYFMERVPPDMAVKLVHTDQAKSKILNALDGMEGMNDDIAKAIDTALGDHIAEFTPVTNQDKGIVTVLRNGKKEYYQVHDRNLLESLASLSPEKLKGIYKISNMFMSPIKALTTGANPFFAVGSNIWRDLRTAYINGSKENPVSFLGDYVKAYVDMARNTPEYQQFQAMGGGSVSHITAERDLMKKILGDVQHRNDNAAQWVFRNVINPIRAIQNLGDAVESSGRFAEFKRQLKAGEDTHKAIYEADDITTNFNRYGTSGRKYNALLMYGNAAVQGIDRMARNFTKGGKAAEKTALKVLLPSLAMLALQKFWNRDDEEEYQNLSAYQKNNYYNFSIGNGKFIRIPKAQLADVPGSAMERFYETAFEGDENAFYDFGEYLFGQLLIPGIPTNFSSPGSIVQDVLGDTVIGPFVDTAANLDFKGSPIESAAMQELPPTMRYDGRTSWAAYYLGQVLNMSPKQIDHIINSSTGVVGRLNKAVGTMDSSQRDWTLGLKNQFVSDSVYSTDTLNRFYDEAQQANYDHQLEPDNPQAASRNAAYEAQRMYISQYNKAANGTKLEPAGQRAARKNLQDTVNAFDPSNMKYKDDLEQIYNDTHDEKIFMTAVESKLEKTENKVKKECQLTPEEYTQMMKDMRQAVEKAYGKILNSNKSSAEKAELLKEAKSDAMSDVRAQYKKKYALRFKEVGK